MNSDHHNADSLKDKDAVSAAGTPVSRPEALIKAESLAYLIWDLPDIEGQESFLQEFGMLTHSKDADRLYMRSYGTSQYIYIGRRAKKLAFVGLGLNARDREDLEVLSAAYQAPIEELDRPGGGEVVRLTDPHGVQIEVCFGIAPLAPVDTRRDTLPANTPLETNRVNAGVRTELAPAPVLDIGHCVMGANKLEETANWYMRTVGVIPTDVQCLDDGSPVLMFMRLDKGEVPAEHHTIVLARGTGQRYLHSAYQVVDLDALAQGQQYLKMKNRKHLWGIGRHLLGSQLFDYWLDPNGCEFEHYTDSDLFTADHPTGYLPLDPGSLYVWGDDLPPSMVGTSLKQVISLLRAVFAGELTIGWLKQAKSALSSKPRPWL